MSRPPLAPFYILPDLHGDPLVEFRHYADEAVLHLCWHGHLTAEEVIQVGKLSLSPPQGINFQRVLNNKSDTTGDWYDAMPWLQYEWLPQSISNGLRAVAYVFSPDPAHQLATQQFMLNMHPYLAIELFREEKDAWNWLLKQ